MSDNNSIPDHFIQRYILDTLRHNERARFRDLRPANVDSNVFAYHLKKLMRQEYISKQDEGYTLTIKGIAYIDQVSKLDVRPRRQPKIMTITAIVNEKDEVIVRKKNNQPMINKLTLPCGMLHLDDHSIKDAAVREVAEKIGLQLPNTEHVGDCYMAIRHDGNIIMSAFMHVFMTRVKRAEISLPEGAFWISVDDCDNVAPATQNIMQKLKDHTLGQRFFEEFIDDL